MKTKDFLQNPFEIAEEWEEDETALEFYRSHKDTDLDTLFGEYSINEKLPTTNQNRKIRLKVLQKIIAWKLEIPMFDYFIDELNERFEKLSKEINKLKKFSEHRHKTIMGLYTEKAVY